MMRLRFPYFLLSIGAVFCGGAAATGAAPARSESFQMDSTVVTLRFPAEKLGMSTKNDRTAPSAAITGTCPSRHGGNLPPAKTPIRSMRPPIRGGASASSSAIKVDGASSTTGQ